MEEDRNKIQQLGVYHTDFGPVVELAVKCFDDIWEGKEIKRNVKEQMFKIVIEATYGTNIWERLDKARKLKLCK